MSNKYTPTDKPLDYLIIGAGPAGLQLAYYLNKNKHSYLILEKSSHPGSFFKKFPRHRKLISINKVYTGVEDNEINLRWDWNSLLSDEGGPLFKEYSAEYFPCADKLVDYLKDYADCHKLNVKYGSTVVNIKKEKNFSIVDHENIVYGARCVIIATGLYRSYSPVISGIEYAEQYANISIDTQSYRNKRVLIIGKGNSAFETADHLIGTAASIHLASPNSIKMAWKTHYVGHLRAVNNNFLDTYHLKSQNAILDGNIQSIEKRGNEYFVKFSYAHAENEVEMLTYDRIIACTGFRFDNDIFDESCKPTLCQHNKLPAQTSSWQSVNVDGLYFAGTLMQYLDYKKHMSGFIHGFRYNVQFLAKILNEKYHATPIPKSYISLQIDSLVNKIIKRINHASSLWQQPGFLVDVMGVDKIYNGAYYYEQLSLPYVLDHVLTNGSQFVISLEFSQEEAADPFNIDRIGRHNTKHANLSKFLHPIIRHYEDGILKSEHHVIEDLASVWLEKEHVLPLKKYLNENI